MTSLYLARHLNAGESSSPLFQIEGAAGYAPAALSSLAIWSKPLKREIAYDGYKTNLDAFLFATSAQKKVFIGNEKGYPFAARGLIPFNMPPFKFTLKKEPSSAHLEKFIDTFGRDKLVWEKRGGFTCFTVTKPADEMIDRMDQQGFYNDLFQSGRDGLNIHGYKAQRFLRGVLYELLCTQTYPAFNDDPTKESSLEAAFFLDSSSHTNFISRTKEGREIPDWSLSWGSKRARVKLDGGEAAEVEPEEGEMVVEDYSYPRAQGCITTGLVDAVLTAKPSPGKVENNIGGASSIPEGPGIVVPYFKGLVQFDTNVFRKFIFDYAFRLCGDGDKVDAQEGFRDFKRGWNDLMATESGEAMAHLVKCAELAIESQARLYVIMDGDEYLGCSILGSGFAIYNGSSWVVSNSAEDFKASLRCLDPHQSAVASLEAVLGRLALTSSYTGSTSLGDLEDPSSLVAVLEGLKLKDVDPKEIGNLDNALRRLNFRGDGFRKAHEPNDVKWFLDQFFNHDTPKLQKPCYIASCRMDLTDKATILLSSFGPDAPSFWNNKGVEIACIAQEVYRVENGKRKKSEEDVFANMPEAILVSPKPLTVAIGDWAGYVLTKKAVKFDLKERAARHRNKGIIAEEIKKEVWALLVKGLQTVKRVDVGKGKDREAAASFDDAFAAFLGA